MNRCLTRAVQEIADSAPRMEVFVATEPFRGAPMHYLRSTVASKFAHELEPHIELALTDTGYDIRRDMGLARYKSTLFAFSPEEFYTVLTRAYQAGRDGR